MQPTSPAFVPGSASVAAVASVPGRRSHSSRSTTNGANGGSGPGVTIVAGPVLYDPAPSSGTRNGGSGRDRTATNRRPATVPSSTAPGLLGQEQQQQPAGQRSRSGQGHQQRQPQPLQPQQDGQDPRPPRESRAELRAKETASGIVQDILREIKGLQMGFAQSLEGSPPWADLAEDQRKGIRRQYLTLLYGYPREADFNTFDQHWMQTTHSVIAKYRALPELKSARSDPTGAAAAAAAVAASNKGSSSKRGHRNGGGRKDDGAAAAANDPRPVLKKFANFLKDEIKQYLELVIRLAVSSGLTEVEDYLPQLSKEATIGPLSVAVDEPLEPDERQRKLGMFVKGLIFLGDLERYREMYSLARLGLASNTRKRGGKQSAANKAAELLAEQQTPLLHDGDFKKARVYYNMARLIQPENGNPFNQIATIDNYLGDRFGSTYHWLRALAVKESFVTARGNLQATLKGPLRSHLEREPVAANAPLDKAFENDVVVIIAMLVLRAGFDETCVETTLRRLSTLVRDRALSAEIVLRTLVSLCAVQWDARFVRPTPRPSEARAQAKIDAELRALETILGLITVLFDAATEALVGSLAPQQQAALDSSAAVLDLEEVGNAPAARSKLDGYSCHLTVVLRRSLPTLRVAAKWIRAHQDYLARVIQKHEPGSSVAIRARAMFAAYVRFANALALTFPMADLRPFEGPLEEDLELRGFGPLRKTFPASMSAAPALPPDGHPNGESFMRISDLQLDALLLAGMESSCVFIDRGRFALVPTATQKAPVKALAGPKTPTRPSNPAAASIFVPAPFALGQVPRSAVLVGDGELEPTAAVPAAAEGHLSTDATAEATYLPATHASGADVSDELNFAEMDLDDDPVDAAMRAALADSDEFDSDAEAQLGMTMSMHGWGEVEERILWPPASARKTAAAKAARSPPTFEAPLRTSGVTALDLLQQLGSGSALGESRDHAQAAFAPVPSPGFSLPNANGSRSDSIWGSTHDHQQADHRSRTNSLAPAVWGAHESGTTSPSTGFGLPLTDSWTRSSASGTLGSLGSLGGLGNGGFTNGSGSHYSPVGQLQQSFDAPHLQQQQQQQQQAFAQYFAPRNSVPGVPGSPYGLPSSFATPGLAAQQHPGSQAGPPLNDGLRSPWG